MQILTSRIKDTLRTWSFPSILTILGFLILSVSFLVAVPSEGVAAEISISIPENGGNTTPILTLQGSTTMTLDVGDVFTDPGVSAFDVEDGDLTESVVVAGDEVSTGLPGVHTITYTAVDSEGAAATVLRTIRVEGDVPSVEVANIESPELISSGVCSMYLREFIQFGEANDAVEVLKLQDFLRTREGFAEVPLSGIYDEATLQAVHAFQNRYAEDVLSPWGVEESTGFVYFTTQKKINELHCDNMRQFELSEAQLMEINAFRNAQVEPLPLEGSDLPPVGGIELPPIIVEVADEEGDEDVGTLVVTPSEEVEGDIDSPSRSASLGEVSTVTESSLGKVFRSIGDFFGEIFSRPSRE